MENKKINTSSCLFNIDSLKAMHSPWDHWHMHEESRIVCIHIVCALCVCVCVKLKQQGEGERVCLRISSDYRSECNPNPSLDYFDF